MTIVGYVSDEMYVALSGVEAEFESLETREVIVLRSSPRGALYGSLAPGRYRVTLAKEGYGSKTVSVELGSGKPHHFRLLSDYAPRVHVAEMGSFGRAGRVPHACAGAVSAHPLALRTAQRARRA